MKRSLLLLTAAAVALTPLAASAAPAKGGARTITYDYSGFSTVGTPAFSLNASGLLPVCDAVEACWDFATAKGEKTVEISASNPSAGFQVWFDGTYADSVVSFCGKGKISVSPKSTHQIFVRPALDTCGAGPGSGTLTAVIKNANAK